MKRAYLLPLGLMLATVVAAGADEVDEIYKLTDQRRLDQAAERLDAYLQVKPRDARGRFLKGLILTDQKRRDDAIAVFRELALDYPELPEPLNNLAVLFAEQGNYEEARNALMMAIKTHPSYATAHENLGDIYAKMASQAYSKALQLNQGSSAAQAKLALVKKLFLAPGEEGRGAHVEMAAAASTVREKTPPASFLTAEVKPVPAKVEPVKPEPVKVEPAKVEPVKKEPMAPVVAKPVPTPPAPDTATLAKREPVKPAEPEAGSQKAREEVVQTLLAWAAAWSAKDVSRYIGYYAGPFKPSDGLDRKAWEKQRAQRLQAPKFIRVQLSDIKVELSDPTTAKASFKQVYQSSVLNSTGHKNLLMRREGGQWRILQELYDG